MKLEELQIGDWVYSLIDIDGKTERRPQRVTGIQSDGEYVQTDDTDVWYHIGTFEPIPITQKILEDNGFVIKKKWAQIGNFGDSPLIMWHFEDDKFLHDYKHELEIHQNDTGKVHVTVPCEYIHQLQQIFRLCGITKEIKL